MKISNFDTRGLEKFSLVEWPGKICANIFTGGCNFRCPFCHNPELVTQLDQVPAYPWEEIYKFLISKKGWIDAIMITGGEPTLHKGLPDVFKLIKEMGYLTGLETNGTNPEILEILVKDNLLDKICMDIKSSPEKYPIATGQKDIDVNNIRRSAKIIMESGISYEFRTTVAPDIIDEEDIEEIGKFVSGAESFSLQQFRPIKTLDKSFEYKRPLSREQIEAMAKILQKYVKKVNLDFID